MVLLNIFVRPKSGYAKPDKIRKVSVDSSQRVEEIIKEKGTLLYSDGRELPLNSSFASNNVQDGDILESCSSPIMSALLSSVLQDLNAVDAIPQDQRTKDRLQPLLGGVDLDPWPEPQRWSSESIKTRIIALAMTKKVLQRDDRYANTQVPKISTLMALYDFMQTIWDKNRRHNSVAHIIKPSATNRNGRPTITWEMLQHKLNQAHRMRTTQAANSYDWIEAFVRTEHDKHRTVETPTTATARRATRPNSSTNRETPKRRRRVLPTPASSTRRGQSSATTTKCETCPSMADSICLDENCMFLNHCSCTACFFSNHPRHIRNHERVPLTDPRAKSILKAKTKPSYCPEYGSGPFAILCTLLEASEGNNNNNNNSRRREFSLSESRLKKIAQPRCRSNLYDRQARGRNAFTCIDSLADKKLVRKELIPNEAEARFSLMPDGESMAKHCLAFERTVNEVVRENTTPILQQAYNKRGISIIVDSREDATYAQRCIENCRDQGVSCDKRELPAGDYLFISKSQDGSGTEKVLPLVIERKSWSDLADSVNGAGKGHRRLDCVRVGGNGQCTNGRCQLCRMKASGVQKVMFIIEGARCLNRDEDNKCTVGNRCKYCKELAERNGSSLMTEQLEQVLYQLQAEHGCLIHFTRGYNETIDSLLLIHRIFCRDNNQSYGEAGCSHASSKMLSYQTFCSNARKAKPNDEDMEDFNTKNTKKGTIKQLDAETFIRGIHDDRILDLFNSSGGESDSSSIANARAKTVENLNRAFQEAESARAEALSNEVVEINSDDDSDDGYRLNESQESIYVLEDQGWTSAQNSQSSQSSKKQAINIDDDSDGDNAVVAKPTANQATPNDGLTRLYIVTGLYEYDTDYYYDINKVWQAMYRIHASKSREEFKAVVLEQLRSMQSDQLPLVKRDSILFWTLHVQLCGPFLVLLHTTREMTCVHELRLFWREGRGRGVSNGNRLGNGNSSRQSNDTPAAAVARKTPSPGLKTPPVYNTEIYNNEVTILEDDEPATTNKRRTPVSTGRKRASLRTSRTAAPVHDIDVSSSKPASQSTPRRQTQAASSSQRPVDSQTDTIREMRLRRFVGADAGGSGSTHNAKRSTNKSAGSAEFVASSQKKWCCASCTYLNEEENSACKMCVSKRVVKWTCAQCTFENDNNASKCAMCEDLNPSIARKPVAKHVSDRPPRPPPSNDAPVSRKRPRFTSTKRHSTIWICEACTLENPIHAPLCGACQNKNSSVATVGVDERRDSGIVPDYASRLCHDDIYADKHSSSSTRPKSRNIKCGACGAVGHNRGSATPETCSAYWNESEIKLREAKKEKAAKKAQETHASAEQLKQRVETDERTRERRMTELQRLMAEQERDNEQSRDMARSELKRRQQAAKRAEKRARKLR